MDMFCGISAFRSAAEKIGGFEFVGYCECDPTAIAAYRTLYHTEGEYFCNDARAINTDELPDFDLLVGGFPCQPYPDLKINEACCSLSLPEFLKPKSLLIFCLRTFPQSVRSVKGKSSLQYSAKYLDWGIVANGNVLTAGLMSPRVESECSLRDILIPDVPDRYFLSAEKSLRLLPNSQIPDVPDRYFLSAEKSLRLLPNSQVTELRENGSTTPEEVP